MAAPTIDEQPKSVCVAAGSVTRFTVKATGATTYTWSRDGQPADEGSPSCTVTATTELNGSKWSVAVGNEAGELRFSDEAVLTVTAAPGAPQEPPPMYDPVFARHAAQALVLVFVLVLFPMWAMAVRQIGNKSFPGVIAVQLVIVGTLLALAGVYLTLLDFRGRARTAEELRPKAARARGLGGPLDEVAKSLPQIFKEFGQLKAPAAVMVVAMVLFVCATAIAWRGLPGSPATPTTTPATTSTTDP